MIITEALKNGISIYRTHGNSIYRRHGKHPYRTHGKNPCHLQFYELGLKDQRDIRIEAFRANLESVHNKIPDMDYSLLFGLFGELNSMKLVHLSGTFPILKSNYENQPVETTPLGYRFVRYILQMSE